MDQTLLDDWKIHLVVRNRAPRTIEDYLKVATAYTRWVEDGLTKRDIEAYLAHLITTGRSAAYVAKVYRTLQQFFKWLAEEEVIQDNPFQRMKPPSVPVKLIPLLDEDEIRRLLLVCLGRGFHDIRDTAIIRVLLDTGVRVSELVNVIEVQDFTMTVPGKGRKTRTVVFTSKTAEALRRYQRARKKHPRADLPNFWLGDNGALTDSGVRQMLRRRGRQANVQNVHPHRFRHQFAHDWLAAGGSEGDLMRLAGWSSRVMLQRYGASGADQRAHDAYNQVMKNRY